MASHYAWRLHASYAQADAYDKLVGPIAPGETVTIKTWFYYYVCGTLDGAPWWT